MLKKHRTKVLFDKITNRRESTKLQTHKQSSKFKVSTYKYQILNFNTTNIHNVSHKQHKIDNNT